MKLRSSCSIAPHTVRQDGNGARAAHPNATRAGGLIVVSQQGHDRRGQDGPIVALATTHMRVRAHARRPSTAAGLTTTTARRAFCSQGAACTPSSAAVRSSHRRRQPAAAGSQPAGQSPRPRRRGCPHAWRQGPHRGRRPPEAAQAAPPPPAVARVGSAGATAAFRRPCRAFPEHAGGGDEDGRPACGSGAGTGAAGAERRLRRDDGSGDGRRGYGGGRWAAARPRPP